VKRATGENHLNAEVERVAREAGASLVGFADVEGLACLPRAVVVATAISPAAFGEPHEMPTPPYYQEYLDLNSRLTKIAERLAGLLECAGYRAQANAATLHLIDPETLATPFPHKTGATRAGLGWIGKSALLVTPEFGPAVRLASVLTDAPLAAGEPITESRCGECTVCQEACPGGAITGESWYAGRPREEFYDAFACRRGALERARSKGIDATICGVCMSVCPRRPR